MGTAGAARGAPTGLGVGHWLSDCPYQAGGLVMWREAPVGVGLGRRAGQGTGV